MKKDMSKTPLETKPNSKKPFLLIALAVIAVIVIALVVFFSQGGPADKNNTDEIPVQVKQGETADQIADTLKEEGIIKNKLAFKSYLKTHKVSNKLHAGSYLLSPSMSTEELVDELLNGVGEVIKVTIPEGYVLKEVAEEFEKKELMDQETFWKLIKSYDLKDCPYMKDAPDNEHRMEGIFYPETYFFEVGSTPEEVFDTIVGHFNKIWKELPENKSGLSDYDTLILASMIEKEAKNDKERPTIASVYLNRLDLDMPMQCDATILYAMPERKTQLRYSDYKYKSIYNTYLHRGLPPTPICNPGVESLKAARQPDDTDYLYYLWDKEEKDGHIFSKTYKEHLKYQKKLGY